MLLALVSHSLSLCAGGWASTPTKQNRGFRSGSSPIHWLRGESDLGRSGSWCSRWWVGGLPWWVEQQIGGGCVVVAIVTCLEEETKRTIGLKEEEPENMERVLPCLLIN